MRLVDADALKEKLRGNAQKDGSPFVGAIVEMFCEFLDQAPTVEDADERGEIGRVPRFIPVTEKLPVEAGKREEAYCFVFVQDVQGRTNFFTTAVFYGDTQEWDLDFIRECSPPFPIYVVTHWMDMNRDIPDISDTELLGVTQNGKTTLSTIIERGRIVGVKCGDEYADYFAYNNADRCVCCGDVIPEGRQVCPACEGENG